MPKNNVQLAAGLVGLVAAHTIMTIPLRRKKNSLTRDIHTLIQLNILLNKQNVVMAEALDKLGAAPTEYDIRNMSMN